MLPSQNQDDWATHGSHTFIVLGVGIWNSLAVADPDKVQARGPSTTRLKQMSANLLRADPRHTWEKGLLSGLEAPRGSPNLARQVQNVLGVNTERFSGSKNRFLKKQLRNLKNFRWERLALHLTQVWIVAYFSLMKTEPVYPK